MPPLSVSLSTRFKREVRSLSEERLDQALRLLTEGLGKPHLHSGLGIRRLRRNYFELRVGREVRAVFQLEGSEAVLEMIGNHDQVQRF